MFRSAEHLQQLPESAGTGDPQAKGNLALVLAWGKEHEELLY